MNTFDTLLDIASGRAPLRAIGKHWPDYPQSTAAFEARLRRGRSTQVQTAGKHAIKPVTRDDLRSDRTYLVVQSGSSFFAAALKPGREAARALATRTVAVYEIVER